MKQETNGRQELAQKEIELTRKNEALKSEGALLNDQKAAMEQKTRELQATLKQERENHEIKVRDLKTETYKSKKTLKEMGEVMKRETSNLVRIFRKKELEISKEGVALQLLHLRDAESMHERQIDLIEENETFNCEKYGFSKETLPEQLLQARLNRERFRKDLPVIREHIRVLKEQEMSMKKDFDAINKEVEDNGEGILIAITSTIYPDPNHI